MNTKWFMNKLPSQHIFGIDDALLAGIRVDIYSYLACEAVNRVHGFEYRRKIKVCLRLGFTICCEMRCI